MAVHPNTQPVHRNAQLAMLAVRIKTVEMKKQILPLQTVGLAFLVCATILLSGPKLHAQPVFTNQPVSVTTNVGASILFHTDASAASPDGIAQFICEHQNTISDGWFELPMTETKTPNYPATRHQQGFCLSFNDGHAEIFQFHDPASLGNITTNMLISSSNQDWVRIRQMTTTS